jgi:hypothetical protein
MPLSLDEVDVTGQPVSISGEGTSAKPAGHGPVTIKPLESKFYRIELPQGSNQ